MKIALMILIFLFSNPDLINYTNVDYHFSVNFPKDYKEEREKLDEKFASIEYIRMSGSNKITNGLLNGNLIYRVICYKFKRKPIINANKLNFHDVIMAYTKRQNESSFTANSLTVTSKQENKDTLYYILTNESNGISEHRKIIIQDSSTYTLSIMTNKDLFKTEHIQDFFNSMKIKK